MIHVLDLDIGPRTGQRTTTEGGRAMEMMARAVAVDAAEHGAGTLAPAEAMATTRAGIVAGGPSAGALRRVLVAADAVAILFGLVVAGLASSGPGAELWPSVIAGPVALAALLVDRRRRGAATGRMTDDLPRLARAVVVAIGAVVVAGFLFAPSAAPSRRWAITSLIAVVVALTVERGLIRRQLLQARRAGDIVRPVVIVGTDPEAIGLVHAAQRHPELGYRPVGFVGPDDIGARGGCARLGGLADLPEVLVDTGATGVVVSLASVPPSLVNRMTRELTDAGYEVALSSGLRDIDVSRSRSTELDGRLLIEVERTVRDGWRAVAKRVFDIVVAITALVLSAPISIAAAIAVKATSPGPIVFAQERVGRDGRTFRVYKFRTMVADADARKSELEAFNEADGPLFKMANDPRITRVGAILRKLSIDEIPQFINVLKGDMSVVGPRPALASEVARWTDDVHDRLRVLPGITGMWQVSGRSDTTFDEYKRLDLFYVDNWSLAHDLRIVLRTFSAVLASKGAR